MNNASSICKHQFGIQIDRFEFYLPGLILGFYCVWYLLRVVPTRSALLKKKQTSFSAKTFKTT